MSFSPDQGPADPWFFDPDPAAAAPADAPRLHMVRFGRVQPLDRQIGAFPKKTAPDALRDVLFGPRVPGPDPQSAPPIRSFAILDAAKVTNLPELLERSGLDHRCLFKGSAYDDLKNVAPWIVQLQEGESFTRSLFTRSRATWHLWDAEPGIYFRAAASVDDMWRHFRKFTRIQDETGKWFYFRFWEAPWLADVVTVMDRAEQARFLGPVENLVSICKDGTSISMSFG